MYLLHIVHVCELKENISSVLFKKSGYNSNSAAVHWIIMYGSQVAADWNSGKCTAFRLAEQCEWRVDASYWIKECPCTIPSVPYLFILSIHYFSLCLIEKLFAII